MSLHDTIQDLLAKYHGAELTSQLADLVGSNSLKAVLGELPSDVRANLAAAVGSDPVIRSRLEENLGQIRQRAAEVENQLADLETEQAGNLQVLLHHRAGLLEMLREEPDRAQKILHSAALAAERLPFREQVEIRRFVDDIRHEDFERVLSGWAEREATVEQLIAIYARSGESGVRRACSALTWDNMGASEIMTPTTIEVITDQLLRSVQTQLRSEIKECDAVDVLDTAIHRARAEITRTVDQITHLTGSTPGSGFTATDEIAVGAVVYLKEHPKLPATTKHRLGRLVEIAVRKAERWTQLLAQRHVEKRNPTPSTPALAPVTVAAAPDLRAPHQVTLDRYLSVIQSLNQKQSGEKREDRDQRRLYFKLFREARIFDVAQSVGSQLTSEAHAYVEKHYSDAGQVAHALTQLSFPGPLPFPVTYIGFGHGLRFKGFNASSATEEWITVYGYLVTDDGWFVAIVATETLSSTGAFGLAPHRKPEGWTSTAASSEPWFLLSLLNLINDQQTFTLSAERHTKDFVKVFKRTAENVEGQRNVLPEPYHLVRLKRDFTLRVARDALNAIPRGPRAPVGYRYDVPAHDRLKLYRGSLPLDERLAQVFDRRGYRLFISTQPDAKLAHALMERDIAPKKDDEWLALKLIRVRDHRRGPEDKPYIPSVRQLSSDR